MTFGIIAEGKSDCAVLKNILIGLGLVDNLAQVRFLRPEFFRDATAKAEMTRDEFGSWTNVKGDCQSRIKFEKFFGEDNPVANERLMIVQIDTAECDREDFGVKRPVKREGNYCMETRQAVIEKISEWLENQFLDKIRFAITVEEMEAWLLALAHRDKKLDTSLEQDPKKAFEKYLNERRKRDKPFDKEIKRCFSQGAFALFDFHSADFQKLGKIKVRTCLENNPSLQLFVQSLPAPAHSAAL